MIILKVTKNQYFPLSLEDTFFEKPQVKLTPSAILGLTKLHAFQDILKNIFERLLLRQT